MLPEPNIKEQQEEYQDKANEMLPPGICLEAPVLVKQASVSFRVGKYIVYWGPLCGHHFAYI